MKRENVVPTIIVLGVLLAGGCIKLDSSLTLTKEGGAVVEVEYQISETTIQQLKTAFALRRQMALLEGTSAEKQPDEIFLDPVESEVRSFFKKYESKGIALDRLKVTPKEGNWRLVSMKLSCKSLADAARSDLFAWYGFDLQPQGDGKLRFFRPAESKSASMTAIDPDAMKIMTPLCEGFRAAFRLNVPGKILESNAHQAALRSAVWTFDQDRDQRALLALQSQDFSALFEADGARLPSLRRIPRQAGL